MYQIYLPKKQRNSDGIDQIQEKKIFYRDNFDKNSIAIFLNFITSDDYMQDVAYGDKIFKLENGQNLIIPLTIILACHKKISIITQCAR